MLSLENITLNVNHNFGINYVSGQNLKELGGGNPRGPEVQPPTAETFLSVSSRFAKILS